MYEFTRTYQGLGRPLYTRSSGGLGRPLYARTYGGLGRSPFTRSPGGLGWLYSSGASDAFPDGRRVCFRTDEQSFAAQQGCRPVYGMGCRQPDGSVSQYPCCPEDSTKTLWECPYGRPGSGSGAAPLPSGTSDATRDQVRALQTAIRNAGCDPGTIDGIWGSRTQQGLQCYAGRVGWTSVARNYPWAAARVGGTPEVGKRNGGAAPELVAEEQGPEVARAGIFPFALPGVLNEWWFWIAAAGITGLGVAGYLQYKKSKGRRSSATTRPAIPSALKQWR